jgi:hypothetical protein
MAATMISHRYPVPDDFAEMILALNEPKLSLMLDGEYRSSPAIRQRIANDASLLEEKKASALFRIAHNSGVSLAEIEMLTGKSGPEAYLEFANSSDKAFRRAVAWYWRPAPDEVWLKLLRDPDPKVRWSAFHARESIPADLHEELAADPELRPLMAKSVELTPAMAAEFAVDSKETVRHSLAENPHLPESTCRLLADSADATTSALLICNRATPEDVRARLHASLPADPGWENVGQKTDKDIDAGMAHSILSFGMVPWLGDLPLDERLGYLDSPYPVFRRALAWSDDLPASAREKLRHDPDPQVRSYLARSWKDAPGEFVLSVLVEVGDSAKFRPRLADHPNLPRADLGALVDSDNPRLRALACKNPELPPAIIARLSQDESRTVRFAAAGHPSIPWEDLKRLLDGEDLDLVETAAASPALPADVMEQLVDQFIAQSAGSRQPPETSRPS